MCGKPQGINLTYPLLQENVIAGRDVDIFLHAWADNQETIEFLQDTYSPVLSKFENIEIQNEWIEKHNIEKMKNSSQTLPGVSPVSVFGQLYTTSQSIKLKKDYEEKNNIKYDWVFRMRFDTAIEERVPIEDLDSQKCWFSPHGPRGMPRDFFWYSCSKNLDKFINIFDKLPQYYYNEHVSICGEEMFFHHVHKEEIPLDTLLLRNGLYRPRGHHQGSDMIVHFPPIL
jgi:hypothetical protein